MTGRKRYKQEAIDKAMKYLMEFMFMDGDCIISGRKRIHGSFRSYAFGKLRDVREVVWLCSGAGELPPGYRFFSSCGNASCFNIDHIEVGVQTNRTQMWLTCPLAYEQVLRERLRTNSTNVGECTQWVGPTTNGYGTLAAFGGKVIAHRLSYVLHNKAFPNNTGGVIAHTCDNKLCINPGHLVACSSKQNTHDYLAKRGFDGYDVISVRGER